MYLLCTILFLTAIEGIGYSSVQGGQTPVSISRTPSALDIKAMNERMYGRILKLPKSDEFGEYDLRSMDLSYLDLSKELKALQYASFDSRTIWSDSLPKEFDPAVVLEQGKDPGLGLRELHEKGITGKGVGIAILDQTLLTDHEEYAKQLKYYKEFGKAQTSNASMHGAAVASIAVGKTTGVAPEALLYYIADFSFMTNEEGEEEYNLTSRAADIDRFIELNKTLPEEEKIRIISYSNGWDLSMKGGAEMEAAAKRAKEAGIAMMYIDDDDPALKNLFGMSRQFLSDPNDYTGFLPGIFWKDRIFEKDARTDYLLVPMDNVTTASPTGMQDYVYYANGGMSWVMPYYAGLYALAYQVKPGITLEEFVEAAQNTAHKVSFRQNEKDYPFGFAVNPAKIIEYLQSKE